MTVMAEQRKKAQENGERIRKVDMERIPQEIETLKAADVWILNEVDWGVKRTQYREVVRELAETLHMNWAYGVEFVEVDSKQLGTDTFDDHMSPRRRASNFWKSSRWIRTRCGRCTAMPFYRVTRSGRPGWSHSRLGMTGSKRAISGHSKQQNEKQPF